MRLRLDTAVQLLERARSEAVNKVNRVMVSAYYRLGEIVLREQDGRERAEYAERTIAKLLQRLTQRFGRVFSVRNLEQMRKFYLVYAKAQTASAESPIPIFRLSWSHHRPLPRLDDDQERAFYELESRDNDWCVRELKRQIDSALYERLSLSRDKAAVKALSTRGLSINRPEDAIKEPYVLEFLGRDAKASYSESDLESAIIDKLEHFLLELGEGFTFVARQMRGNRLLRSFVLIDLNIGDLKRQDIGQLQMYVNYYDREVKLEDENPMVGLILCKDKSDLLVKYTLPQFNNQIFASRY